MQNGLLMFAVVFLCALGGLQANGAQPGSEAYDQAVQITPLLQTDQTNTGQPVEYPKTDNPEISIVKVVIPPGVETGWHKHPVHGFAVILQGELNIKRRDGESLTYRAGDAFAEMTHEVHRGKNVSDEPVELIMFIMGEKGLSFSISADP